MKQVAIVHYNTPELAEACILSIRKNGGDDYRITVLDNSDKRPFRKRMKGVKRIDNTKGQAIDFEAELAKYPDRATYHATMSNYGSMKHCMSVQYLWEALKEPFLLVESDVIVKADVSWMWQPEYAAVGRIQWTQPGNIHRIPRLLPLLCWMNVPLLVANGARYYDPMRCWAMQPGKNTRGNWYDTGAALLEDIINTKPQLVARNMKLVPYIEHLGRGSWNRDLLGQLKWLDDNKDIWK